MLKWLNEKLLLLNPTSTKVSEGGYTRLGFSKEEQLAIEVFTQVAKELELVIEKDAIGNVTATLPGVRNHLLPIAFGSHLDTVVNGGAYDGVTGVLAGLGVIKQLKKINYQPLHPIKIICFISEESARFGISTIGSKAMTGMLNVDRVKKLLDQDKVTLESAWQKLDIQLSEIKQMDWKQNSFHSFVELHTEQGPLLQQSGKKIGIVKAISSPLRFKIKLTGEASHSGTTPMGKRKDALAAAAHLITYIESKGDNYSKSDHFVATVSTITNSPNSMNVIPETVELGVDIRSINETLLDSAREDLYEYCKTLSESSHVKVELSKLSMEKPIPMDAEVVESLKLASKVAGMSFMEMISGAGHDAMNMAQRWPSSMIFIPCNGTSHHPKEYTETSNILNGVQVLLHYIRLVDRKAEK